MNPSDYISALALLVAGGALALEVRRWVESGARLSVTVINDMVVIPDDDGRPKAGIIVYNRGQIATTISACGLCAYASLLHRLADRSIFQGILPNPGFNFPPDPGVPKRLEVNEQWMGRFWYDDRLTATRQRKQLYVAVWATHRRRPYLKRVRTREEVALPGNLYADA